MSTFELQPPTLYPTALTDFITKFDSGTSCCACAEAVQAVTPSTKNERVTIQNWQALKTTKTALSIQRRLRPSVDISQSVFFDSFADGSRSLEFGAKRGRPLRSELTPTPHPGAPSSTKRGTSAIIWNPCFVGLLFFLGVSNTVRSGKQEGASLLSSQCNQQLFACHSSRSLCLSSAV
jgi:hypothetical protein